MDTSHEPTDARVARALGLLRAARTEEARELLAAVCRATPRSVDAHWLLALLHFNEHRLDAAAHALRAVLALAPRHAPAHALHGEVLAALGQLDAAAAAFRQALELRPDDADSAGRLGHVLREQGRAGAALELADAWLQRHPAAPALLRLRGQALLDLGRAADAAAAFARMLAAAPDDPAGAIYLATAQADCGDAAAAERTARASIAHGRDWPEARFVLARALMAQRRGEEAVAELRRAIAARPDYVAAHVSLCELLWMQTGDAALAGAALDRALQAYPGLTALRIARGRLLEAAGSARAAMAELEAGIASSPADFELRLAAAQAAVKCDPARALAHAQRALALRPDDHDATLAHCAALLGVGNAPEAEAVATHLLAADPQDGHAIALRACAWRQLGDARYRELYDYGLVVPQRIDTPPGWSSLAQYLADLAAGLRRLHTYAAHPVNQSLRLGTQADLDFARMDDPALRAFPQAIDGPIRSYMRRLGQGVDVLRARNTGRYALAGAWSVRLRPHGHHVNHVHPQGWLSSACYVSLPSRLGAAAHAGWIAFGQPPIVTAPMLDAEHFVRPEAGLLVLFPSWMWHGTVPFDGSAGDARLTIAFDVVPA